MKHKSCGVAASLALALGTVLAAGSWSSVVAQEQDKEKPKQEQPTDKAKGDEQSPHGAEEVTVSGRVTGGENDVLTVTDEQQAEHKLTVTGETKVTKGGQEASAADLKPNSKVTVQARKGSDGAWTAVSIDILSE